ncbi:TonB-dependent receptor [Sphingomonas canadensis]|uniref:TonB-dependent receptor n=1 Tax=Sphingomonas canadensis TaxID=1219257 RepID=A0ABW3H520_9SPHN|nr:TonB-dependent receptor [Sphingomonas canadensis]MCW3835339.1 TonB-dependent receptor [Sphingomonas canadensis]
MIRSLLLASAAFLVPAAALAAPADGEAPAAPAADTPAAQAHDEPQPEIVVTGLVVRSQADVLSGTSVVTGEELTRNLAPTIGETLASQPGVSATSFGPNASRPVLRGMQGERVRILTDGIGSFDASNTSADHAVVINPLTAERIEVLRGPAALLFGSSAAGGVVNVFDSRIPRSVPEELVHADSLFTYGSAANERAAGGAIDLPVAGKLVLHTDASWSKTGDLRTGGYILTPALRAAAAASGDPEIAELADLKGKLPNSGARTWDVAAGAAVITDRGNVGFSYSHYDNLYGVPVRYSLDPAIEAEAVRIHVKQDRFDMRGEVETGGFIDKIRLRLGAADYQHSEIEDTGAIGTTFYNQGYEGRLELVQAERGAWLGAVGGQFFLRDLNIDGDEKFLPKNRTQQYGLFTLQSLDLGALKAEAGARVEHSIATAFADADLGNPDMRRSFTAVSASAGASYGLADRLRVGINVSRTARAPSAEELYANGPHAGTAAYEIGNPGFGMEKSWTVEGTIKGSGEGWSFQGSVFQSWFNGYIYDYQTGAVIDDLPVFQFAQADARYFGVEGEASVTLGRAGGFAFNADALADYVRATITGQGPAPRIPPLRILGGLEAQSDHLNLRVEAERSFAQDRISVTETPTKGFTLVNASLSWTPQGVEDNVTFTLSANNIFDVEARRHASVLKDYAPLAGRDIRVTARLRI